MKKAVKESERRRCQRITLSERVLVTMQKPLVERRRKRRKLEIRK